MLVVVLRQGTKSSGPAHVTGSSCAGQPGAWGQYLKCCKHMRPPPAPLSSSTSCSANWRRGRTQLALTFSAFFSLCIDGLAPGQQDVP